MEKELERTEGTDVEKLQEEKEKLEKRCGELERRCEELEEYAKRLKASFENYKAEAVRERQRIMENANEYLINRLVPILDDFDRALRDPEPTKNFVEGIEKIYKKFLRVLENEGLTVLEPEGRFDPFEHEAFEKVETDEHEEYSILDVVEKGYKFHGKVVKPAKVRVAVRKREGDGEG